VQDACLKALASLGEFNGRATLATWLHRITVNCAKDAMRSQDRREARDGQPPPGREQAVPSPASDAWAWPKHRWGSSPWASAS
jgi:RNA polymerase sigma-70 factor (ECF subfamily)